MWTHPNDNDGKIHTSKYGLNAYIKISCTLNEITTAMHSILCFVTCIHVYSQTDNFTSSAFLYSSG